MNHEQFEQLLANALGGELSAEDRAAFEVAVAENEEWRREYENAQRTLSSLAELGAPERVVARREGDALVIEPTAGMQQAPPQPARGSWRYAAAVLIAFTAGYALHAALVLQDAVRPQDAFVTTVPDQSDSTQTPHIAGSKTSQAGTFQAALVKTHTSDPSRSTLAKALIAVAAKR